MPGSRSATNSIETDAEHDVVLAYLKDPGNIPHWAPDFADSVKPDGSAGWTVSKAGTDFSLRVAFSSESGTVDYLRQIAPGREGGAYARVIPRLGGGSVIVLTLPVPPTADHAAVAATLARELQSLLGRLSSQPAEGVRTA